MDTQNTLDEDIVTDPNVIIDRLGGTSKTAAICEIKPPSVTEWRTAGLPKSQRKFLRAEYPEVFRREWSPPPGEDPTKYPAHCFLS